MSLTEAIRARAIALGFDDCRFTTVAPPATAAHFRAWLEAGCHGGMGYLQRTAEKRVDPRRVLPEARSLITLAASYALAKQTTALSHPSQDPEAEARGILDHPPAPLPAASSPATGFIARFARFADYHDVLDEPLRVLVSDLEQLAGVPARSLSYVDTGPILERDLAQRAGLGFIGKHTNLISPRLGNWFFLAEILTSLELEPDPPQRNHCGSCARCLAACPTQAITAPFQLDARRCISYLTIESRESIPLALRPAIGDRIFGCDDCLAVCPWNRFARAGRLLRETWQSTLSGPGLVDLLGLSDEAFRSRFRTTPLLRAKRSGLLRNVCIALGNVGDRAAMSSLRHVAATAEPLIAETAIWAMDQIERRASGRPPSITPIARQGAAGGAPP